MPPCLHALMPPSFPAPQHLSLNIFYELYEENCISLLHGCNNNEDHFYEKDHSNFCSHDHDYFNRRR